jgi:hypothetical protein
VQSNSQLLFATLGQYKLEHSCKHAHGVRAHAMPVTSGRTAAITCADIAK